MRTYSNIDVEQLLAHSGWVKGLAARLLHNAEDTEDVVQDTWVAALKSGKEVLRSRGESGLRSWLAGVTSNLAWRRLRQKARSQQHGSVIDPVDDTRAAEGGCERVEMQQLLSEEMLSLDEPNRTAVILHYFDGLPYRAVASRLGVTEEAARQRVSRGVATLRARLKRKFSGEGKSWTRGLFMIVTKLDSAPSASLLIGSALVGTKGITAACAILCATGLIIWSSGRETFQEGTIAEAAAPQPSENPSLGTRAQPVASPTLAQAQSSPALAQAPPSKQKADRSPITAPSERIPSNTLGHLRVIDDKGQPLAGARVSPAKGAHNEIRVTTGEDGYCQPSLRGSVQAFEKGEASVELFIDMEGYQDTSVMVATLELVNVTMLALPEVHGQLFDRNGSFISTPGHVQIGVLVEASGELDVLKVDVEEAGRFSFTSIPLGQLRWISAKARGHVETRKDLDTMLSLQQSKRVDLLLDAGALIEGVVIDAETEEALPGAFVWSGDFFWNESDMDPYTTADANGRFRLDAFDVRDNYWGSDRGKQYANLMVFGKTKSHSAQMVVVLQPRQDDSHYSIVLRLKASACTVAGTVRGDGGKKPASSVLLRGVDSADVFSNTVTDRDGRFRFENLPPGAFDLFAWREGSSSDAPSQAITAHLELEEGRQEELTLELATSNGSRIAGQLTSTNGVPCGNVTVFAKAIFRRGGLTMGSLSTFQTLTNSDGHFQFEKLPPFRYVIHPQFDSGNVSRPDKYELVIAENEAPGELKFVVGASATFGGVIDSDATELGDLHLVLVESQNGEKLQTIRPDAEGRFLFSPVLLGYYTIQVLDRSKVIVEQPIGPSGSELIDIVLR